MTPEQWQQVKRVFDAALERSPAERDQYLDQMCSSDPVLRREVDSLIAHEEAGRGFLDSPEVAVGRVVAPDFERLLGARIGAYRVVEKLGSGGMGSVYRAVRDDDQYQKRVAIKLIRLGLDTESIIGRFRTERQILASLDHPNIARLLDGGTTEEGLPYFVMELIEGLPIDEHCDKNKLTITERLKLFQTVCSAVQYAHQHLVVHRDIKPGNILITSDGTAKLLDFGIAKLLSAQEAGSQTTLGGMRPLTPEYASPEQLRGDPISTASDVYSLGLVLYRLLSGHSAYRLSNRSLPEIVKAVNEGEVEKPSSVIHRVEQPSDDAAEKTVVTPELVSGVREGSAEKLARRLRGDLDNIVLKAVRKEQDERYGSVEQFSDDIRRQLEGLPVIARHGTAVYRIRKFIHRHRAGMAAGAAIFVALIAGIGITLREARIALAERAVADQRFDDVRAMARSNLFELHDAVQQLPGSAPVQHLVIQRALDYLDKLSQESNNNRDLMRELAAGYERIAGLQGNFKGGTIGDSKAALASYRKALAIRDSLISGSNRDVRDLQAETTLLPAYTICLLMTGGTEEASQVARRFLGLSHQIVLAYPRVPAAHAAEAYAHVITAAVLGGSGASPSTREISEAIGHEREALKIATAIAPPNPDSAGQRNISNIKMRLAFHLSKARNFDEAESVFDDVAAAEERRHSLSLIEQAYMFSYRGRMYERMGDYKRALVEYQKSLLPVKAANQADPSDLEAKLDFEIAKGHIAIQQARLGSPRAGLKHLEEAIATVEPLLAANPAKVFYRNVLLIGDGYRGEILSATGNQAGAQECFSKALATATAISQIDPHDLEFRLVIAKLHDSLGVIAARARRNVDALQELAKAENLTAALLDLRPKDAEALYLLQMIHDHQGALKDCPDGHLCKGFPQLALPTLLN